MIIKGFSIKSGNIVASGFESDQWSEILRTATINPTCFGTGWPKIESAIRSGAEISLVFATKAPESEICLVDVVKLIGGNPIEINVEYDSIYSEPKYRGASARIFSSTVDALYRSLTEKYPGRCIDVDAAPNTPMHCFKRWPIDLHGPPSVTIRMAFTVLPLA